MTKPIPKWDNEAVRELSARSPRIHVNTGWSQTSWSADVRAVVDDEVAVLFKQQAGVELGHYVLLHRWEIDGEHKSRACRYGALPRADWGQA